MTYLNHLITYLTFVLMPKCTLYNTLCSITVGNSYKPNYAELFKNVL